MEKSQVQVNVVLAIAIVTVALLIGALGYKALQTTKTSSDALTTDQIGQDVLSGGLRIEN